MDPRDSTIASLPRPIGAPKLAGFARQAVRLERSIGVLLWSALAVLLFALSR